MKKIICLLAILSILTATLTGVSVSAAQGGANSGKAPQAIHRTVRVGYYSGDELLQSGSSDSDRKSGYAYDYYQAIAPVAGWKYEYFYGTKDDILNRLIEGDIDITAGISMTDDLSGKVLFSEQDMGIGGEKLYFAVNNNQQTILSELNYAMQQILIKKPEFTETLIQEYYNKNLANLSITDAERQFLDNKGTITIGYIRDLMPLCDELENGKPTGVIVTLAGLLSNYMGVDVEMISYDDVSVLEADARTDKVDVLFPIYLDSWVCESKGLRQTDPVINDRRMIVYKGTYSEALLGSIALSIKGMGQRGFMNSRYPDSQLTYYNSIKDELDALESGQEQCIIGSAYVMQKFMSDNPEYQDLKIVYTENSEEIGMAVNDDDSLLAGIVNKAIASSDKALIPDALVEYSATKLVYTFRGMIQNNALPLVVMISIFFIVLLIAFIAYFRQSRIFNEQQALTKEALENALETANSANAAKTKFLSSMSHDIRTPMNAIIGMTTIASANIDNKLRVQDCLEKISRSGKYLITLINDVLDISKIESGRLKLNPTVFSISNTINTIINVIKTDADEKNLTLTTNVHDLTHDYLLADEVRLNQIYINIVSNAVKYTPEKGDVILELYEEEIPGEDSVKLVYIVKDTGIGMSEEFMKTMYETFTRAEDKRISAIQGTGLGLSIVKQMVDLMGGTIDCQSTEGEGTQFTITLNLTISDVAVGDDIEIGSEFAISNLHVLVAEDYELNWEVISELLSMHKITADWVKDGKECVERIKSCEKGKYDLILMDVQMPVMDGREAARRIRMDEDEYVKHIPIIAMSADAFAEDIEESRNAGMNAHLSKPVDIDILLQEVSKILGIGGGTKKGKAAVMKNF